ncbi:MAG: hypothetical protein AAF998_16945 [Bacteroidota bacterium]
MIRLVIILWFLGNVGMGISAQGLTRPKELPAAFRSTPKVLVGFDSKRSFIDNRDVRIFGVRAGLEFDRKVGVGFGIYFLRSPFVRNFIEPADGGGVDTIRSNLRFGYVSAWFEYMIYASRRWEVSVPLTLGFGEAEFSGFEERTYTQILLLEASLEAQYKIFPWLGLGAGVGYRQPITGERSIRTIIDAPIYRFGIRVFLGYFWNLITGKEVLGF